MLIFLWPEDWSQFLWVLEDKGIEHGGEIIKFFGSPRDPRLLFEKPKLFVVESNGSPFKPKALFSYGARGTWTGKQLEDFLRNLSLPENATQVARALFRFANRRNLMLCQTGMQLRTPNGKRWLINHPMNDIDGFQTKDSTKLHLDIFVPISLIRLHTFMDIPNFFHNEAVLTFTEATRIRKRLATG